MDYFDDLSFLAWDSIPEYGDFVTRGFRGIEGSDDFKWYALQFNYAGKFRLSVGKRRFRTYDGAYAWITHPSEKCRFGSPEGMVRYHRHVGFAGERVKRFISSGLIPETPPINPTPITQPDIFATDFDQLIDELNHGRTPSAVHLLEGLLMQLHYQPPAESANYLTPRVRKLAREIIKDPGKVWDFHEEAQHLCISQAHFRRVFQQVIHTPPGKYLQWCRLQRAAELLRTSQFTIAQIADEVGIQDVHYFTRLFCRQYQMPPMRYRKHLSDVSR